MYLYYLFYFDLYELLKEEEHFKKHLKLNQLDNI